MHELDHSDQKTRKEDYDEGYYGLQDIPTWTTISEQEYSKIKHIVCHAFPTMDIFIVKYDENGNPKRTKWRIVALSNLNPHEWSTNNCFAPVISIQELRFMVSLAVHHKCILRSDDIKQAFCKAAIPDDE